MGRKGVITSIIVILMAIVLLVVLLIEKKSYVEMEDYYISCGCGCCAYDEPLIDVAEEKCLPPGRTFLDMKTADKSLGQSFCETAGCSMPIKYVICER